MEVQWPYCYVIMVLDSCSSGANSSYGLNHCAVVLGKILVYNNALVFTTTTLWSKRKLEGAQRFLIMKSWAKMTKVP